MTEEERQDKLGRAIRGLSLAVWVLAALTLVQTAFYAYWYVFAQRQYSRYFPPQGTGATKRQTPSPPVDFERESRFHDLSPEEKIRESSAILLTAWRKDGDRMKPIITEIVKKKPDVTLYFDVGDEYDPFGHSGRPMETAHGDGEVVFLTGSPAMMRSACSFSGERISCLADMPLKKLRELAAKP